MRASPTAPTRASGSRSPFPGDFRAFYQSKSSTCAYAAEIFFGLLDDMRTTDATDEEITTTKASFIETFPNQFASAAQVVGLYASRRDPRPDHSYWVDYRDNVAAVNAEEIKKAMNEEPRPRDDDHARRRQHRGDHGRPPRARRQAHRLRRDQESPAARPDDPGADRGIADNTSSRYRPGLGPGVFNFGFQISDFCQPTPSLVMDSGLVVRCDQLHPRGNREDANERQETQIGYLCDFFASLRLCVLFVRIGNSDHLKKRHILGILGWVGGVPNS